MHFCCVNSDDTPAKAPLPGAAALTLCGLPSGACRCGGSLGLSLAQGSGAQTGVPETTPAAAGNLLEMQILCPETWFEKACSWEPWVFCPSYCPRGPRWNEPAGLASQVHSGTFFLSGRSPGTSPSLVLKAQTVTELGSGTQIQPILCEQVPRRLPTALRTRLWSPRKSSMWCER